MMVEREENLVYVCLMKCFDNFMGYRIIFNHLFMSEVWSLRRNHIQRRLKKFTWKRWTFETYQTNFDNFFKMSSSRRIIQITLCKYAIMTERCWCEFVVILCFCFGKNSSKINKKKIQKLSWWLHFLRITKFKYFRLNRITSP
jgi:hypothetical protein